MTRVERRTDDNDLQRDEQLQFNYIPESILKHKRMKSPNDKESYKNNFSCLLSLLNHWLIANDRSKIINVTGNRNKLPWVWLTSLGYGRPGDFMMYSLTYVRSIVTYFERKMHDSCPWKHYYSIFGKHNENSCFNSLFSVIYLKKIVA